MGSESTIDISRMDTEALKELRGKIDAILDGPADKMDSLDAAVAAMKAMREKVAVVGKSAVSRAIKTFLAKHPEVESVRWQQYTPYFNDGEPCEFGVRDTEVRLVGAAGDEGDCEDGYQCHYSIDYAREEKGLNVPESLVKDMEALDDLFEQAEDAMKATFGDHVQVTVGRDGEAEVEEYEHD